jgi:hypothetical protein
MVKVEVLCKERKTKTLEMPTPMALLRLYKMLRSSSSLPQNEQKIQNLHFL